MEIINNFKNMKKIEELNHEIEILKSKNSIGFYLIIILILISETKISPYVDIYLKVFDSNIGFILTVSVVAFIIFILLYVNLKNIIFHYMKINQWIGEYLNEYKCCKKFFNKKEEISSFIKPE